MPTSEARAIVLNPGRHTAETVAAAASQLQATGDLSKTMLRAVGTAMVRHAAANGYPNRRAPRQSRRTTP